MSEPSQIGVLPMAWLSTRPNVHMLFFFCKGYRKVNLSYKINSISLEYKEAICDLRVTFNKHLNFVEYIYRITVLAAKCCMQSLYMILVRSIMECAIMLRFKAVTRSYKFINTASTNGNRLSRCVL